MPSEIQTPETETPDFIAVTVASKTQVACEVWAFTLVAPDGSMLQPFTPGSHVTVVTPKGARRNYSLCGRSSDLRGQRRLA